MNVINITSRKNAIVKSAALLNGSAEKRRQAGAFLVEGARLTADAAISGTKILRLFYTENAFKKYSEYINPALEKAQEIYMVEEHVAELLSATKSTQGVFALCQIPKAEESEIKGKILVLENIQDPSNMGAILRTSEALGIGSVMLSGDCCDIYSPKALRASMGAVFRTSFHFASTAEKTYESLKKYGYVIYGSVPDSKAVPITQIKFRENSAVIIGNEGNGLTESLKKLCDFLITIPMGGRAESFNAGVAASIIMWEMIK